MLGNSLSTSEFPLMIVLVSINGLPSALSREEELLPVCTDFSPGTPPLPMEPITLKKLLIGIPTTLLGDLMVQRSEAVLNSRTKVITCILIHD